MPKKPNGYWTEAKILEEAKKYKTLKEFREKANGAYCAASKLKITHKLYNLTTPGNIPNFWTKEKCFEEAKKYNTKIEFHDSAQGAWNASKRNGWIEEYTWLKSTRNANYGKTYTFNEINENGIIDSEDCYSLKTCILNSSSEISGDTGDINGDGVINVFDSIYAKKEILSRSR